MTIIIDLQQAATDCNHVPPITHIEKWLNEALKKIPRTLDPQQNEVTIRVVERSESATLNQQFRHKSGPTNVLAFPDTPFPELPSESLGDLVICAELVESEANEQDKTIEAHWAHLIIHGFLHLLGYDHIQEEEALLMEALEANILHDLGFANPYV